MGIRIENYFGEFKIVSLALDEKTKCDLIEDELNFIFLDKEKVFLFPGNIEIKIKKDGFYELLEHKNYDVYEIWPDGRMFLRVDTTSIDNYFFVTGKCNSNCIMCPSSDYSRENGDEADIKKLIDLVRHIPSDTSHLTITGGEPFLSGEDIFEFIQMLRDKFLNTEFLFLTNGRVFALEKYAKLLQKTIPDNSILAIPIHASYAELHDCITQTKGSFEQTIHGIKRLLGYGIRIEVRIVITKVNCNDINNLADLIIREIPQIEYVSVIAMEMTGNAFKNRDRVWIPYRKAFACASEAIKLMINKGIDVKLYNFPLCTVPSSFWTICEKSISPSKVCYSAVCDECTYKEACGGVFAGTINMEREELKAII